MLIAEGEEYEQYEMEVTEKPLLDGLFFGINLVRETYCETITRLEPVSYDQQSSRRRSLRTSTCAAAAFWRNSG
jgi:hypothetical protein